jgi:uncharacterized membrane protein
MSQKDDALQEIVTIVRNNRLTLADITAALGAGAENKEKRDSNIIGRVFNYIGGILVFAGLCIFVGMFWESFGSVTKILVTLGTGFAAFLFALAAMDDAKYDRAATPLLIIAALFQPAGIFVMLDEFSSGGKTEHGILFMAALMIIQQGATFWHKRRTTLAFTTALFFTIFAVTLMEEMNMPEELNAIITGLALLGTGWVLAQSPHRPIAGFAYFCGSAALMFGVYETVENTFFEISFLALAAFFVYASTVARSRVLLAMGTLGMLGYIGDFAFEHFDNQASFPILLMTIGIAFFGLGAMAIRINKKFITQKG